MFTGIVEETGQVVSFTRGEKSWRFVLRGRHVFTGLETGDSISVNGCCLTAVAFDATRGELAFDVLEETRRLTNLGDCHPGDLVNLERSLAFGGKLGGHFVSGHIDGKGTIQVFEARGTDYYLRVGVPAGFGRYLIPKGSVAIDGISLTVVDVEGDSFAVWLIPHTLTVTNLQSRKAGQAVNLEFDLLGKYVEKLLGPRLNP